MQKILKKQNISDTIKEKLKKEKIQMELKMKHHYSYFIYPYVIKEKNYNKYIQQLLNSSKYTLKSFERRRESSIYNFFLPNIRKYMFGSFDVAERDKSLSHSIYDDLRENILKSNPCTVFEYNIGKDTQAKIDKGNGIFFKIEKIEIICFKIGICFLSMKTNLEDTDKFSDFLDFNAKFKNINSEIERYDLYKDIKIQTSTFDDIKSLSKIIKEITGGMEESRKIAVNRFLVYSYICIDKENWNENVPFSNIQKEFYKATNVIDSKDNQDFENERLKLINLGDYIKLGISKAGMNFITSSINSLNYTKLPFEYENEYLYTYIFSLYTKLYLEKIIHDFGSHIKVLKSSKEFLKFTSEIWVHELTSSDNGTLIFENIREVLGINEMYQTAKEEYDVAYKGFKMKNNDMLNKIILILLAISIMTNIINFINLYKLK